MDWNGEVLLDTFVKPQEKVCPLLPQFDAMRLNRAILIVFCVVCVG